MLEKIRMPQLGESITEGTVSKWLKSPGDYVHKGELLLEIVTDKVNAEMPSPFEGTLVSIEVGEGQTVSVGTVLGTIETQAYTPSITSESQSSQVSSKSKEDQFLSPIVRKLLKQYNLDPSQIQGSGAQGRITKDDVLRHIEAQSKQKQETLALSGMRKTIAEHMMKSSREIPSALTVQQADVSELVAFRQVYKDLLESHLGFNVTIFHVAAFAAVKGLLEFPIFNSSYKEDSIVIHNTVNLGIAVSVNEGLIVPVIKDAQTLSFIDLASRIDSIGRRARSGKLNVDEIEGGTFTLDNTGATGSLLSYPIIHYPQAAILTTEKVTKEIVVNDDNSFRIGFIMRMCLAFDHRVTDGATAGKFLSYVAQEIQSFDFRSIKEIRQILNHG